MRARFERGFIDYIKHGNEQRLRKMLAMLRWATSTSNTATGVFTQQRRFCFLQILLRSLSYYDNDRDKPAPVCRRIG